MAFVKNNATPLTSLGIFQATRFLVERWRTHRPYPQLALQIPGLFATVADRYSTPQEPAAPMLQRPAPVVRSAPVAEGGSAALGAAVYHDPEAIPVATAAGEQRSRVVSLALWMAGAIASYIVSALAVRALAKSLSVFEIMSLRSAGGLAFLLALMAVRPKMRRGLTSRRIGLHLVRNSVHFVGQIIWALAVTLLPLATVFALEFTAPIWVALLAVMLLGERLTATRAASIALCLVGVLVILHPGLASFTPVALLALAAAFTRAFTDVVTKKLTQSETTFAILFWMNLMQLPMNFAGSDPLFITRLDSSMALPVIGIAVAGFAIHLCVAQAFRYGDAMVVVPLDFLRVPLIAVIGWSFYGEALDALVLAGASLIMAGVIWNLRTEVRAHARSETRLIVS
jgi:drug/metabolite transporter (DMT)-like permease